MAPDDGASIKRLFNTSGLVYKSMGLKDKLPDMTEDQQLRLLSTDGMLVKTPGDNRRRQSVVRI